MNNKPHILDQYAPASLNRRAGAMLYDTLLVFALLFVATLPALMLNSGKPVNALLTYKLYLLLIWFGFHGFFWTRNGKTLGMQTWKIRIVNFDGGAISWKQASLRFLTGFLGLANLWTLIDKNQLGWHERISGTVCIHIP